MKHVNPTPILLATLLAVFAHAASAADALTLEISQTVSGVDHQQTLTFKSFDVMVNTFKTEADLRNALNWDYNGKLGSYAVMNNMGVKFYFTISPFSNGTTTVTLDVPGTTLVNRTYIAGSRDSALSKMKDDIVKQYSSVQTALAKSTPSSVVAGNPTSVQSQLASSQFEQGFTTNATQVVSTTTTTTTTATSSSTSSTSSSSATTAATTSSASSSKTTTSNLLGFGLRFGQYKQGDLKSQTATLPLGYSWRFDDDERRHVTLSAPLTLGKVDQSKVFNAQLSLSVGIPINTEWSLTPSIGYGMAGSVDLAQAAQQVSATLTSAYTWVFDNGQTLSMGNMVGYYTTVKMKVDEYTSNPDISNTILRNGLMYSVPIAFDNSGDTGMTVETSLINTRYLGSELYVKSTNEYGLTFGTNKRIRGATRYLRAGVSYISAKGANGFAVNVGYWF